MKRCPACRRDYYDDSLSYCLDDGSALLDGPAVSAGSLSDEPSTAILPASRVESGEMNTAILDPSAARPSGDVGLDLVPATINRSSKRPVFIIAAIAIVLLVAGSFFGYRYLRPVGGDQINSIAVLPFEDRSGSGDTEYLADGLTDSLIFRFAQLPDLKVSPTSSVMHYKGSQTDVAQVAKELDVDAVLSGRLAQIGDSLSISVQLIDAKTKKLIWAEQYDRKMADLLTTQREIASAITQKLQLKLAGNEKGISKKYTSDSQAYQLYLKGRFHWAKRKKEDMLLAIDAYKKAIDIDPNFALAYVGIAEVYNSMGKNPDIPPKEAIPLGKAAAIRALEIDPTLAEAHSALADSLALGDWDWPRAEAEFRKAIEIDPNISYIHVAYSGSYLTAVGRPEEAAAETAKAIELEPLSLINNALHVASLMNARRNEEALVQARKTYELDRDFPLALHWLGLALSANGKYDEAISLGRQVPIDSPISPIGLYVTGYAQAKAGRRAEALETIARLKEAANTHYIRPYYVACIWAALGDKDRAFAELERSFAEKDCYIPRIKVDPALDELKADPRYGDLLKRMGIPQ